MKLSIFRYNPERDTKGRLQDYEIEPQPHEAMLLDLILRLKRDDDSLTIRRSCREGVCGSDAINIEVLQGLQPTDSIIEPPPREIS